MLSRALCRVLGHDVNRHRVWHDSIDYRTDCDRCGRHLLRDGDGWHPYDGDNDADAPRMPHPKDDPAERG